MQEPDLIGTLRSLCEHGIQFILVGGLAAVLNGSPVHTYDVDVVYCQEPGNIERLLSFLQKIDAVYRIQPERRLRPTASHLAGGGHLNLMTSLGHLDLLGTIGQGLSFSDLLPLSHEMTVGEGISIRVLNLETLISIKEQLASEKDLAALPILRQTLRELKKSRSV
jgi:hypothetical protein